ncbi:methyl-accepting chemotaxis protein [Clostridium saccharoperbutylacetonicum]|uniref:methyl-accepting chemotaxis protein n=1 Tax=Clostridium saccharoperbutylacetonicum TaxID=36745 RepID=UPI000983CDD5|nr:methyl-accepting chemotaxis protein [Clostridium saccharoperbutylacetonicum]AQR97994.1 methyl-accepting chemotaxis protein McpB [Clostridium saccharoperbutylacetonicum]NSB33887.1 methyl-accepting chemotaxis protein [Clostridium saccharoperbutylacetonicum]
MRITIRQKLYGGFAAVLLFLVIVAIANYVLTSKVNTKYTNLVNNGTTIVSYIKDLNNAISDEQASVNYYLITGDANYFKSYQKAFDSYNEKSKKIGELIKGQDSWQILQGLDLIEEQYVISADQMIDYKKKNNIDKYTQTAKAQNQLIQKFSDTSDKFIENQEALLNKEINETESMISSSKILIIVFTFIILFIGFGVAYWISNLISKPIVAISKTAIKIADGDLTGKEIQIKSNDEISDLINAFNIMTRNLRKILTEVEEAAAKVAISSDELTTGAHQTAEATKYVANISQDVATGTERQVDSVEKSVQAAREMSNEADEINSKAYNANNQALKTSDVVMEGNTSVQKAVEQMNAVKYTVTDIANIVNELGNESKKINDIIAIITNIASQTNLLALNASIEAARAGDAGKGFAVVAAEVSKLAEQTSISGKQVSEVIRAILLKTEKTISVVTESEQQVKEGIEAVHAAGISFNTIENSINDFRKTIEEVSMASKQMSESTDKLVNNFETIEEISKSAAESTQSVSAFTEEQLATMEGVTNSANSLNNMSERLINLINTFKLK